MMDLTYSPLQERAIEAIVAWYGNKDQQEFYLAGYAGTGKSTVVSEAISRIKEKYKISSVPTGAYTGKAAYVLRKKGNPNAQTIHSMIYKSSEDPETGDLLFSLNMLGTAAMADLIVLDECSMIDHQMANDLRSFDKKLLIMGDPGQLPPINGEGPFTSRTPDFFLDEIHRQTADSPIIELATMARQGIALPIGYRKDNVHVQWLSNSSAEAIHNPDTQVLCGLNRIRWSVTQIMRQKLGFSGEFPIAGEKILCCKNNKDNGLFNGGSGVLHKLELRDVYGDWHQAHGEDIMEDMQRRRWRITAEIEGMFYKKLVTNPYLFQQHFDNGATVKNPKIKIPNEFDWGYVWSVHKAQGSGWPHVTLIDNSPSFRENRWKHLYTGLTRAEEGLTVLMS